MVVLENTTASKLSDVVLQIHATHGCGWHPNQANNYMRCQTFVLAPQNKWGPRPPAMIENTNLASVPLRVDGHHVKH
jgi:hypothetical protein